MHTTNLDLTLSELTKVEGTASLDLQIRNGQVTECKFSITEMKRFFTQAIRGKPIIAVPQLVARICGTCSNAHLLCSLKAMENGLGLEVSPQTKLLRQLLNNGLLIRDHGLHLYVFALPDIFNRDSILDFDENDPDEHRLLHDCFAVKEVGNKLGIAAGGRSVHAPYATVGGFTKIPTKGELQSLIPQLTEIRPRILHLIDVFLNCDFTLTQDVKFLALVDPEFSLLEGELKTSDGANIPTQDFSEKLTKKDIPFSQATGYLLSDSVYMVGALARLNLNRDSLHPNTTRDAVKALDRFPSTNIFHNNLAQAIEMLHAVDASIDLLNQYQVLPETPIKFSPKEAMGVGVIEAPRGILFHKMELTADGKVRKGTIIVPTGQNQIGIENSIRDYISSSVDQPKEVLSHEIEKIIRAYDPCMSCATSFLKINWK